MGRPSWVKESEIIGLANQGLNSYKIAKETKVSIYWVRKIRKEHGDQTPAREREQELNARVEANQRQREKNLKQSKKHKKSKTIGWWNIPEIMTRQTMLKPTPEQEKFLEEMLWTKDGLLGYLKECYARGMKNKGYYKGYRKKNKKLGGYDASAIERQFMSCLASAIRGINLSQERDIFPFIGAKDRDFRESNNAKVMDGEDGKEYLYLFQRKYDLERLGGLEILFQPEKGKEYYKPLREAFNKGFTWGLQIKKAKNDNWYVYWAIPRPKVEGNYVGKIYILVQPFIHDRRLTWCAYFYDEDNRLVLKDTIMELTKWYMRTINKSGEKKSSLRKYYVRRGLTRMFRKWRERWSHLKPVIILLPTQSDGTGNFELRSWNPEGRTGFFAEKCKDKLAKYDGMGANLDDKTLSIHNIEDIRFRLSL